MESGFRWAPFGPSSTTPDAPAPATRIPARRMAVVTCMDARVDPLRALGLQLGDAHVIRNAGGLISEDVLRSLALSHELAGTTSAVIVAHSDCVAHGGDDDVARAATRDGVERLRAAVPGLAVSAAFYDLAGGRVSPL